MQVTKYTIILFKILKKRQEKHTELVKWRNWVNSGAQKETAYQIAGYKIRLVQCRLPIIEKEVNEIQQGM